MSSLDINKAVASNELDTYEAPNMSTKGISDQKETLYVNELWNEHWGYFNTHSDLKSAVLMKAVWNVGKGYECDPNTKVILDHIKGMGKDTFIDILFNMEVVRRIGRDAFAEIIRDEEGLLLNLKPLDPSSIRIVVDGKGIIIRYEQIKKLGKSPVVVHKFMPEEIFHLSNNRLADQIHGISDIESLDKTLLAELESFDDIRKLMHTQAKPFIVFKLKTDDQTKINELASKIEGIRNAGTDLYIPDDENILSYDVVQVNPSSVIMEWRNQIRNKFYRALGVPSVIFGVAGGTESGSKVEYLAHEQVFERDQKYIENQIWQQLGLRINLIPPTTLLDNMQTDEAKDANQGLNFKPADMTAGTQ